MSTFVYILIILSAVCMVVGGFLDFSSNRRIGRLTKKNLWVFGIYLAIISVALQSESGSVIM